MDITKPDFTFRSKCSYNTLKCSDKNKRAARKTKIPTMKCYLSVPKILLKIGYKHNFENYLGSRQLLTYAWLPPPHTHS